MLMPLSLVRYKAATLPLSFADPLLPPTIVRQAANREQLRLAVAAALISGLKQVRLGLQCREEANSWQSNLFTRTA